MSRDRSAAMFARIGSYGKYAAAWLKQLRHLWGTPIAYRREDHYMRGRGPKWREKHSRDGKR